MTTTRLMTAQELLELPQDHQRHELISGELTTMAPAGGEHGIRTIKISLRLGEFIEKHDLGVFFAAETGFVLKRNPDTVRAADFAFVQKKRVPKTGARQKFWPVAPDLVVEVLSPSDTAGEVLEKIEDWLDAGTRLVWVVDPERKKVKVYAPGRAAQSFTMKDQLSGEEVLPGLLLPVAEIFR
jgi:Uma2 family endonuclease